MKTAELLRSNKFPFTPMREDADILPFFKKHIATATGSMDNIYRVQIHSSRVKGTLSDIIEEGRSREYMKLQSEFQKKWNAQNEIFEEVPFTFVYDKVKSVMSNLLNLNPRYITFELTEDCSVFFQAMIRDKNLYLELFFTDEVKEGVEAVTTIYQNGEAILAYGGNIEDTLAKISSKVSTPAWFVEQTASSYGVSETSLTEATL